MVAKYQTDLAAANTQAVNGFGGYTSGAADVHAMQIRPKLATTTGGPGPVTRGHAAALPVRSGRRRQHCRPRYARWRSGGRFLGAPSGEASDVMSTLLPAVLGGVAGVAGGLLGALSGAGQKIGQAGTQLVGGLAQGASSAMGAMQGPGGGKIPTRREIRDLAAIQLATSATAVGETLAVALSPPRRSMGRCRLRRHPRRRPRPRRRPCTARPRPRRAWPRPAAVGRNADGRWNDAPHDGRPRWWWRGSGRSQALSRTQAQARDAAQQ